MFQETACLELFSAGGCPLSALFFFLGAGFCKSYDGTTAFSNHLPLPLPNLPSKSQVLITVEISTKELAITWSIAGVAVFDCVCPPTPQRLIKTQSRLDATANPRHFRGGGDSLGELQPHVNLHSPASARSQGLSSPMRGCKFECVCFCMAGVLTLVWGCKFWCVWSVSCRPTHMGLRKLGYVWSSQTFHPRTKMKMGHPKCSANGQFPWKP